MHSNYWAICAIPQPSYFGKLFTGYFLILYFISKHVLVEYVYVSLCGYVFGSERAIYIQAKYIGCPRIGVVGDFELPGMGARK